MSTTPEDRATESAEESAEDHVRYIVVVHGMGEPRENATLLPVINRFVCARYEGKEGEAGKEDGAERHRPSLSEKFKAWCFPTRENRGHACVTLGQLSGASRDRPWVEFEGIPKSGKQHQPFIGTQSSSGDNLRFVDVYWGDVTQKQFQKAGQKVAPWSASLIDRLRSNESSPKWAVGLLEAIRAAVLPVQAVLSVRDPKANDLVFNRFLGDVQMYGEDLCCRGRAVRRLHDRLAKVDAEHRKSEKNGKQREARYTIIAHSLGTIMALDALMSAHAKPSEREKCSLGGDSFDGYANPIPDPEERYRPAAPNTLPDVGWIEHVDHLVTLGSPIDKFLVIWWFNYGYLASTDWMDPTLAEKRRNGKRIKHSNYCDEQDPVGHELDVAYTREAVHTVFGRDCEEDEKADHAPDEERIYVRYVLPGQAHIEYWNDQELFERILARTVDGEDSALSEGMWYREDVYRRVLDISHRVIPMVFLLVAGFSFARGVVAKGLLARVSPLAMAAGLLWLGCNVIKLMTEWRQALAVKRGDKIPKPESAGGVTVPGVAGRASGDAAEPRDARKPKSRKTLGKRLNRWVALPFWSWSFVSLGAAAALGLLRAGAKNPYLLPEVLRTHLSLAVEATAILYAAGICGMILYGFRMQWYRQSQKEWAKYK